MRPHGSWRFVAFAIALGVASAAHAEAPKTRKQTPQERKRQQLLDELGLERVETPPQPPPAPAPAPGASGAEASPPGPAPGERAATAPAQAPGPAAPSFRRVIHPLLVQSCQVCHRTGGPATASRLILGGEPAADYAVVRPFVNPGAPPTSTLLGKASGQAPHGGGAPWPAGGEAHARVLAWIAKGARLDGGQAPAAAAPALAAPAVPAPADATHRRLLPPAAAETAPTPTGAGETPAGAVPPQPAAAQPTELPSPAPAPTTSTSSDFDALLMTACAACHNPRGAAAPTRLVLSGDPAHDEAMARGLVDVTAPARSLLVTKATGELHGGGIVLAAGDPRLATLLAWIQAVATPAAPAAPNPGAPAAASAVAPPAPVVIAPAPPPVPHGPPPGLTLPGGFLLNGRFDLAYERRQFSGNPFADGSTAALRSYHHFLFLSRESATDPFGLSVEMLSLQFWEAHARLGGGPRPWRLVLAAGKIIVPFGADPLTHQSYGGLAGFDQMILPVLWTQEGAAAHLIVGRGRLLVTDDLFAVRGYALPHADSVLNLQSDFSPADDARIGWGNRLGVSWLVASAWYSAYFNPLGFGRWLFMQALDVTVWRPRAVPVLGHFSAAAGLLRADVSGGGSGLDYYHFGSYFQLRYHPTDWLYLQYRQGLRTFNNRRGVIVDDTRLGPEDGSTHNLAIVGRYRNLSVGLAYFLLFEKAGEIPNDFLRASVTYDF